MQSWNIYLVWLRENVVNLKVFVTQLKFSCISVSTCCCYFYSLIWTFMFVFVLKRSIKSKKKRRVGEIKVWSGPRHAICQFFLPSQEYDNIYSNQVFEDSESSFWHHHVEGIFDHRSSKLIGTRYSPMRKVILNRRYKSSFFGQTNKLKMLLVENKKIFNCIKKKRKSFLIKNVYLIQVGSTFDFL